MSKQLCIKLHKMHCDGVSIERIAYINSMTPCDVAKHITVGRKLARANK